MDLFLFSPVPAPLAPDPALSLAPATTFTLASDPDPELAHGFDFSPIVRAPTPAFDLTPAPPWTNLDQLGPTWTNLDQIGPIWNNLDQLGQFLTDLIKQIKSENTKNSTRYFPNQKRFIVMTYPKLTIKLILVKS